MEKLNHISASPHVRGPMSTAKIMKLVIVALLPTAAFGVFHFGLRALLHMVVCIVTCALTETVYEVLTKRPLTVLDFSAVITGLLLALTLPVGAPLWIGAVGGVFAILVVKMFFGGIGQNIVNPALAARCFLLISFAGYLTDYTCDVCTGPTPLAALRQGEELDLFELLLGNTGGCIGETSTFAILIGAIFLLSMGVINLRIPASCILVFMGCMILFGGHGFEESYLVTQLCGGGLMLGAWFMMTDYTTSPITKGGQLLYGAVIGALAAMFRLVGNVSEGLSYAILLGNLLVPS